MVFEAVRREWGSVPGDAVLATAILDRLLHHCDFLAVKGGASRNSSEPAHCCRTIMNQADNYDITAADPLPEDLGAGVGFDVLADGHGDEHDAQGDCGSNGVSGLTR